MKKAERLHYDMNTSTFYRVTNDTGEMKRSYVNGSEIPFFKPGITGISYMERKVFSILHRALRKVQSLQRKKPIKGGFRIIIKLWM